MWLRRDGLDPDLRSYDQVWVAKDPDTGRGAYAFRSNIVVIDPGAYLSGEGGQISDDEEDWIYEYLGDEVGFHERNLIVTLQQNGWAVKRRGMGDFDAERGGTRLVYTHLKLARGWRSVATLEQRGEKDIPLLTEGVHDSFPVAVALELRRHGWIE